MTDMSIRATSKSGTAQIRKQNFKTNVHKHMILIIHKLNMLKYNAALLLLCS
jgi:hypothetical protein